MTWQTELQDWIKNQHGSAGWEQKLEAFIQDLLDRKAREIEELKYEWDGLGLKKVPVIWQTHNQTIDDALSILKEE